MWQVDESRTVLCVARELSSLTQAVGPRGCWPFTTEVLSESWRLLAERHCADAPSEPPYPRESWPTLQSHKLRAMLKGFFHVTPAGSKDVILQHVQRLADARRCT